MEKSEISTNSDNIMAVPHALGTGLIITVQQSIKTATRTAILSFISEYESTLSRFLDDSLVSRIAQESLSAHGGHFDFPDYAADLFDIYDALFIATQGTVDPLIGEDLIRLGYNSQYSFTLSDVDKPRTISPAHHWGTDITHDGSTLITTRPVHLDFGAVGKGFLVDLLAEMLHNAGIWDFTIDAGGDIYVGTNRHNYQEQAEPAASSHTSHTSRVARIGLEDPHNTHNAIGIAEFDEGSLCSSAPSRRKWTVYEKLEETEATIKKSVHHLLDAHTGKPTQYTAATWAFLPHYETSSGNQLRATAWADGLATALFTTNPSRLLEYAPEGFQFVHMSNERAVTLSEGFPGDIFSENTPQK